MLLQDEAMRDPLAGPAGAGAPNGAAAGEERHNGGAGGGWMHDARWSGLRKRGEDAGWLVDPSQVDCCLQSCACCGASDGAVLGACLMVDWAQSDCHIDASTDATICITAAALD